MRAACLLLPLACVSANQCRADYSYAVAVCINCHCDSDYQDCCGHPGGHCDWLFSCECKYQSTCDTDEKCCGGNCCSSTCCSGDCCSPDNGCCTYDGSCCSTTCCDGNCCDEGDSCCGVACCSNSCCGGSCCDEGEHCCEDDPSQCCSGSGSGSPFLIGGCAVGGVALLSIGCYYSRRGSPTPLMTDFDVAPLVAPSLGLEGAAASLRPFQAAVLANGTDNWSPSRALGSGGFGTVYRVESLESLPHSGACAVKKLDESGLQGSRELLVEIQVLGTCRHENVLPLLGFCLHPQVQCLVYPLMSGGNFEDRLMLEREAVERLRALQPAGTSLGAIAMLTWQQRLRILRDSARGLHYLHLPLMGAGVSKDAILHRDIKPANILLDGHLNAKLSDVGLARQSHELGEGQSFAGHSTSIVVGTPGYIDPIYTTTSRYGVVTDNYALGMTMLVSLVCRPIINAIDEHDQIIETPSLAPGSADVNAEWPRDVAIAVAALVKGLTFSRSPRGRADLPSVMRTLETLCDANQVPNGVQIGDEVSGQFRECVVCMAEPRAIRFGCGHLCCCEECSERLRQLPNSTCPTCRAPIQTADGASAIEPTFVQQRGSAAQLAPAGLGAISEDSE
jgi:hypothetical protein